VLLDKLRTIRQAHQIKTLKSTGKVVIEAMTIADKQATTEVATKAPKHQAVKAKKHKSTKVRDDSEEKWYQKRRFKITCKILSFCILLVLVLYPFQREAPISPRINSDGVADALEKMPDTNTTQSKRTIKFNSPQELEITADNTGIANWYNPETNQVNFVFNLHVNDKLLYQSGQVPPGNYIQSVTLKEPLAAGEYDGTLVINTFNIHSGQPKNGMTFKIKLKVD
jgi:hypothetical protein